MKLQAVLREVNMGESAGFPGDRSRNMTRMGGIRRLNVRMLAVCAVAAVTAAGCTDEQVGTIIGAGTGAAVGHSIGGHGAGAFFGTVAGGLAGAWVGGQIGKSMDETDRLKMQQATGDALENGRSGTAESWTNPDNDHKGSVTPQPAYKNDQGQYCREYQQTVTIGGKTETAYGTACRQPDGSWRISNT
jgi:surface antigen